MTVPRIYKQLDEDANKLLRLLGVLERINDGMAMRAPDALAAAAYDREHGGAEAWCDTHEREVSRCRSRRLPCLGRPLPRYTDRVGDSVVGQVLTDAWAMEQAAAMLHVAVELMESTGAPYLRIEDPAAKVMAQDAETANQPKCQIHLRHGWDVNSRTKAPTRLRHNGRFLLSHPLRLCDFCQRHVIATGGKVPTAGDIRKHATKSALTPVVVPHTEPIDVSWSDSGAASVRIPQHAS